MLSVIIPCFNEEQVIEQSHCALTEALDALDMPCELLYVDDGSTDGTAGILRGFAEQSTRVRMISLSRNFGHQVAMTAGIEHARGDAVVLIDADLQDPPGVIAEMVARWREGYDVVYGRRTERIGETAFKRTTAALFYRLINKLCDTPMPIDAGDFRLMDRRVVDALRRMPEHDRFMRGMVSWLGFRQVAVPYRRDARAAGQTKYPLFKMIGLAFDAVLSFSTLPLRLATWIGLCTATLALIGIAYALFVRLFLTESAWVPGWASLLTALLLLGGVQLMFLGLIGEYIARIYRETKRRPLYLVQERLGFDDKP